MWLSAKLALIKSDTKLENKVSHLFHICFVFGQGPLCPAFFHHLHPHHPTKMAVHTEGFLDGARLCLLLKDDTLSLFLYFFCTNCVQNFTFLIPTWQLLFCLQGWVGRFGVFSSLGPFKLRALGGFSRLLLLLRQLKLTGELFVLSCKST